MKKQVILILTLTLFSHLHTMAQAGNVGGIATLSNDTLKEATGSGRWIRGGFVNVAFSQVSLSNWAPGGVGSFSVSNTGILFANYDKGRFRWDNNLNTSYAVQKSGDERLRKTDDQIDLTSKIGYRTSSDSKWYYSALFNFKSQFANGYDYPNDSTVVSHFLAPAFVVNSLGLTYRPADFFEVFISPVTSRITLVQDETLADLGSFGVTPAVFNSDGTVATPGKKSRGEFGAYLNARFKKEIMTNVTLATRLELFNNYADKNKSNRKNIDVNWETGLLMKVNKLITASIIVQVVCDDDVLKKTQYRQVIGFGLGYKFGNGK